MVHNTHVHMQEFTLPGQVYVDIRYTVLTTFMVNGVTGSRNYSRLVGIQPFLLNNNIYIIERTRQ